MSGSGNPEGQFITNRLGRNSSAVDGKLDPFRNEAYAAEIAVNFLGGMEVSKTDFLATFHSECLNIFRILSVYRLAAADGLETRVYVSTTTSSVPTKRQPDEGTSEVQSERLARVSLSRYSGGLTMERAMIKGVLLGGMCCSMLGSGLNAQFHNPGTATKPGTMNPQAVYPAAQAPVPAGAQAGRSYSGADMILPDAQRQGLSQYNVHLNSMEGKQVDIWGRAIHHSDGSFTESRQDIQTNTLEQITKSKNGTRLQRRMIVLNAQGRPSEVMIYDGRDQFKYRGLQVYDPLGRFAEEQIYDTAGTLIRRKVQEYNSQGQMLPMRSWDYVANVPEDLKLVITQEEAQPAAPQETPKKERTGLFGGKAKSQTPVIATAQPAQIPGNPAPETASPGETQKGLKLGRLFGGKKQQ